MTKARKADRAAKSIKTSRDRVTGPREGMRKNALEEEMERLLRVENKNIYFFLHWFR